MAVLKSKGLQQSLFLAIGNVGASGFSAISLIILSRYLGPAEFGGFSVAFSLTQLTARLLDFGFNLGMQRHIARSFKHEEKATAATIYMVGRVKLLTGLLTILLGLLIGPFLGRTVFNISNPWLITIGVSLAGVIIVYDFIVAVLQAMAKFLSAVLLNGVQAVAKFFMAVFSWFLLAPNSFIAYLWYGLAPVLAILAGWLLIPKKFKLPVTDSRSWKEVVRYMKFGAVGVLAAAVSDNIDVLMVNASLSEYETGLFSAASRVSLMVTMFAISFGTVFNTRAASYKNKKELQAFTAKAAAFGLASLLLIPVSFLAARPLILLTAGAQYLGAVPAMQYLVASALVMMAIMPFIAVFYAVEYPAYFAVSGVIQTVVLIGANAVLIPILGINGAGMAKLLTRVIVAAYTIYVAFSQVKKLHNIGLPSVRELRDLVHV